ncbi:hypothetical protein PFISCL1PPCAC_14388, partial [Pristionchus fissidentatus]
SHANFAEPFDYFLSRSSSTSSSSSSTTSSTCTSSRIQTLVSTRKKYDCRRLTQPSSATMMYTEPGKGLFSIEILGAMIIPILATSEHDPLVEALDAVSIL